MVDNIVSWWTPIQKVPLGVRSKRMSPQDSKPVLFTPKAKALTTKPAALVISEPQHAAFVQWFIPQPSPIDSYKGLQDRTWTCHDAPIAPQIAPSSFRRSGASSKYSPVPIGTVARTLEVKMLVQTDRHRPDSLFLATHQRKSSCMKPSKLKL